MLTKKELGEAITRERLKANMTATELAEKANVAKSSLSEWEQGKISLSTVTFFRICQALKITPNDIIKTNDKEKIIIEHIPLSMLNENTLEQENINIHDRIKQLLKHKHITAKQMCIDLNIPYGTFMTQRKRRSIRMSLNTILDIAKYLNTTLYYLVNGEQNNQHQIIHQPPNFTKEQIKTLEELLKTLKEIANDKSNFNGNVKNE